MREKTQIEIRTETWAKYRLIFPGLNPVGIEAFIHTVFNNASVRECGFEYVDRLAAEASVFERLSPGFLVDVAADYGALPQYRAAEARKSRAGGCCQAPAHTPFEAYAQAVRHLDGDVDPIRFASFARNRPIPMEGANIREISDMLKCHLVLEREVPLLVDAFLDGERPPAAGNDHPRDGDELAMDGPGA